MRKLTLETTIQTWVVGNAEGGRILVGQSWGKRICKRNRKRKEGQRSGT